MKAPCHSCGEPDAFWEDAKGGRFMRHEGGGSCRFPCRRCTHLDCAEVRGDLAQAAEELATSVFDDEGQTVYEHQSKDTDMAAKKKTAAKAKAKAKPKAKAKAKAKPKTTSKDLPKSKHCPRCDKTRQQKAFYIFKRKNGPQLSSYCRECYRAANKEWKEAQA